MIFNLKSLEIPEGFNEEDLYIGTWDEESLQWIRLESQLIPDNNQIMTEISGFSMYAVMVSPQPAKISVTSLALSSEEIQEGDIIQFKVENMSLPIVHRVYDVNKGDDYISFINMIVKVSSMP